MKDKGKLTRYSFMMLCIAGLVSLFFSSCQIVGLLFGVTIDQRVQNFSDGYSNRQYTELYKDFADSTQERSAMKVSGFWDNTPFGRGDNPQALTGYSIKGSTVSGTFMNASGSFHITIEMIQSGIDWYIRSITLKPTFQTGVNARLVKEIR